MVSFTDSRGPFPLGERLVLALLRVAALRPRLEDARLCDCVRRLAAVRGRELPLDFLAPPLDLVLPLDLRALLVFRALPADFALPFERGEPWAILTPFLRSIPDSITPRGAV
jgi:hypothetical protein